MSKGVGYARVRGSSEVCNECTPAARLATRACGGRGQSQDAFRKRSVGYARVRGSGAT